MSRLTYTPFGHLFDAAPHFAFQTAGGFDVDAAFGVVLFTVLPDELSIGDEVLYCAVFVVVKFLWRES